jgi:hypothetical protein
VTPWFARTVISAKVLFAGLQELFTAGKGFIVGARQQAENLWGQIGSHGTQFSIFSGFGFCRGTDDVRFEATW